MNKQKKKKRGKKSVQNLLGLQGFTTYGLKTTGGELVYFAIQPTNISVLSHANIEIKIRHLLMVLTALPHLEVACLDSAQRFDDNQQFMESRIRQEDNPKVRYALAQDREFLDSIQLEMSTARQFVLALRFKNEKDSQIFSRINDARKALHDEGFEARRMGPSEVKRMLALYFEASMTGDQIPDVEGSENFDLSKLVLITSALVIAVAGSGFWLVHYFIDSREQRQTYETLAEEFVLESMPTPESITPAENSSPTENSSEPAESVSLTTAPPRHDLTALAAENSDCVGWLTIPDTGIDYPVMHTPDTPEHYLRRDFYGEPASAGTPFLDGRNAAQAEGQNLILYGHNMMDGSMFKPLISYLEPNFRETHKDIFLEIDGRQYHYEVLAVVETSVKSTLYTFTDLSDPAEESDFRAALLKETELEVVHQASGYLTLSTCNNGGGNSRVLVIAALAGEVSQ